MSGGSFNYLYCADASEIGQRCGDLEEMATALDTLCPEAAAATREIITHIRATQPKLEALSDLWHAVEWWMSSDYDRGQAEEAVAKYRAGRAAAEPNLSPALQQALAAVQARCTTWHRVEVGQRWFGERLYDLLPCMLDKHDDGVPHRDPAGNTW